MGSYCSPWGWVHFGQNDLRLGKGDAVNENVWFKSGGLRCAGDLYVPEDYEPGKPRPGLVLGHGFGGYKKGLVAQAEFFQRAGYVVLGIDYRYFGDSEGEPRGQLFPLEQVEDFRNAITYLQRRDEVDPERIGLWGTSFGGAVVIYTAAVDRRVKATVAQVPVVNGRRWMQALRSAGDWDALLDRLDADRIQRYESGQSAYVPHSGTAPEAAMPTSQAEVPRLQRRAEQLGGPVVEFERKLTLESVEKVIEFFPDNVIHLIGPRSLRIVTTAQWDVVHLLEQIQEVYRRANEPKELVLLPFEQYDFYSEPGRTAALESALECFRRYLPVKQPASAQI